MGHGKGLMHHNFQVIAITCFWQVALSQVNQVDPLMITI